MSVSLLGYTGMLFEYIYKYLINFLKIFPTEVFKDIYTKKYILINIPLKKILLNKIYQQGIGGMQNWIIELQ